MFEKSISPVVGVLHIPQNFDNRGQAQRLVTLFPPEKKQDFHYNNNNSTDNSTDSMSQLIFRLGLSPISVTQTGELLC